MQTTQHPATAFIAQYPDPRALRLAYTAQTLIIPATLQVLAWDNGLTIAAMLADVNFQIRDLTEIWTLIHATALAEETQTMQTLIAFMTPRNPIDLFDEMLGSSATIQIDVSETGLTITRRDGTPVDAAQVGTLYLCEEGTPMAQYLEETTPNGDGFGGRDARGVSREVYQLVAQQLVPLGIKVTRK